MCFLVRGRKGKRLLMASFAESEDPLPRIAAIGTTVTRARRS